MAHVQLPCTIGCPIVVAVGTGETALKSRKLDIIAINIGQPAIAHSLLTLVLELVVGDQTGQTVATKFAHPAIRLVSKIELVGNGGPPVFSIVIRVLPLGIALRVELSKIGIRRPIGREFIHIHVHIAIHSGVPSMLIVVFQIVSEFNVQIFSQFLFDKGVVLGGVGQAVFGSAIVVYIVRKNAIVDECPAIRFNIQIPNAGKIFRPYHAGCVAERLEHPEMRRFHPSQW